MSLYEKKVGETDFVKKIKSSGRPKWLNISIIFLTIYTLTILIMGVIYDQKSKDSHKELISKMQSINEPFRSRDPKLFAELNAIVERSEATYKSNQNAKSLRFAVLTVLTVSSGIYFLKSISVLGFFIGGVWSVGLIEMMAFYLKIDVEFLRAFKFVITYGPGEWFHIIESLVQISFAIWIYCYSALKFKANEAK